MKTKITYLFLLLMTMVLGLHSCKADKVDGAVFSLSIDGKYYVRLRTDFRHGEAFLQCGMEPVKRPILVYLIKCIR